MDETAVAGLRDQATGKWRCAGAVVDCDPPERSRPTPAQVREQEQAKETVKDLGALWWDDLIELSDENAQVCVDAGRGKWSRPQVLPSLVEHHEGRATMAARRKRGRPSERTMPDPIDADHEDVMRAFVSTSPKKREERRYLSDG